MKTPEQIQKRIKSLKELIDGNYHYLTLNECTLNESDDIADDNYQLKMRIRLLEWVLK